MVKNKKKRHSSFRTSNSEVEEEPDQNLKEEPDKNLDQIRIKTEPEGSIKREKAKDGRRSNLKTSYFIIVSVVTIKYLLRRQESSETPRIF